MSPLRGVMDVMDVRIREAGDSDRDMFWRATLDTAWGDIPDDEKARLSRREFEQHFKRAAQPYLEEHQNRLFVAVDEGGRVIGYTLLGRSVPFYSPKPYCFVFDIFVAEDARRRGVAQKLLDFAFEWFRDQGLDKVKLEVAENNHRAMPLYVKMGFRPERRVMGRPLR